MNAHVTVEQAPTAGTRGEGRCVWSPRPRAGFLQHLQLFEVKSVQGPARGEGGAGFVSDGAAR